MKSPIHPLGRLRRAAVTALVSVALTLTALAPIAMAVAPGGAEVDHPRAHAIVQADADDDDSGRVEEPLHRTDDTSAAHRQGAAVPKSP